MDNFDLNECQAMTRWTTEELPPVPKWFRKELVHIGKMNALGEPNLRVVNGMTQRAFVNGNPTALKYMSVNNPEVGWACFVLERWASPEFFDESTWAENRTGSDSAGTGKFIDYLGPFPRRGDYITICPLVDSQGKMLPLSSMLLDEIRQRVVHGSANVVLGAREVQRRRKAAENAATVTSLLDELQEYYNSKGDKINRLASRVSVGPSLNYFNRQALEKAAADLLKGTPSCPPLGSTQA